MANIYSGVLSGTMDAFASVISNNQNLVMKFLATITAVMSIPTMVASSMDECEYQGDALCGQPPRLFCRDRTGGGSFLLVAYLFNKRDMF